MPRARLAGLLLLMAAVAFCWADVALAQARGGAWAAGLGGGRAPLIETVFALLVYGPLIVAGLLGGVVERRNAAALGVRPGAAALVGLAAGLAGLNVAVVLARLAGVLADGAGGAVNPALLLWGVAVVAVQVFAEEVYFRGWLQPALARRWGQPAAIVAGALAFALLHVAGGARAPLSLVNLFAGGVLFGLFAARAGGLAAALGAHFAWNAAEQLVWGLDPNPGIGSFGALFDRELVGQAIWGGSADGLNGSIGMTVALVALLLPLLAASWRRLPAPVLSPTGLPG